MLLGGYYIIQNFKFLPKVFFIFGFWTFQNVQFLKSKKSFTKKIKKVVVTGMVLF
jgi:hypothetical protein